MKNGVALGHRMDGSAHFIILWHENKGFSRKTGRRMKKPATFFILWHKNESERAFMILHETCTKPARAFMSLHEPARNLHEPARAFMSLHGTCAFGKSETILSKTSLRD